MTNRALLLRAARACHAATRKPLKKLGLVPGQDDTLLAIHRENGISSRVLAASLGVAQPTVTKASHRLKAFGLIAITGSKEDRRMVLLTITEKGLAMVEKIRAIHESAEEVIRPFTRTDPPLLPFDEALTCIATALEAAGKPKRRR